MMSLPQRGTEGPAPRGRGGSGPSAGRGGTRHWSPRCSVASSQRAGRTERCRLGHCLQISITQNNPTRVYTGLTNRLLFSNNGQTSRLLLSNIYGQEKKEEKYLIIIFFIYFTYIYMTKQNRTWEMSKICFLILTDDHKLLALSQLGLAGLRLPVIVAARIARAELCRHSSSGLCFSPLTSSSSIK